MADSNGLITEYTYNGMDVKTSEKSYQKVQNRCYNKIEDLENKEYIVNSLNQKVLVVDSDSKDLECIVNDGTGTPISSESWQ